MKLAEALTERADAQKRIEQLRRRLLLNAKVQEGEKPAENPDVLLEELDELTQRLTELIARINLTNTNTKTEKGTLTLMLAKRDMLSLKIGIMREFLDQASSVVMRGTKSEVKIKSSVSVAETQKKVDALSKEFRELDVSIQELNWTTDLL